MKQIITIFLCFFFSSSFVLLQEPNETDPLLVDIELNRLSPERDRSNSNVPIECNYNYSIELISFDFLSNIGNVTITITNMMTSEDYSIVFNTAFVHTSVPLSNEETGYYCIQIVSTNNAYYVGYFNII